MPDMTPHVLSLQQGDDIALQYLGAAVVLQWEALPEAARDAIWQQAESVAACRQSPRFMSSSSRSFDGLRASPMPRGPKGEKHPADVIGNAAPVCAIAFVLI